MTTNEVKLGRAKKCGRILFAVADALGTAGKFCAKTSIVILGVGVAAAVGADIAQKYVNKYKNRVRTEKRN
jgi:hypothetical protein